MRTIQTLKNRQKILDALAEGWTINTAVKRAGIGRQSFFDWRKDDPEFNRDVDAAMEASTDLLEEEATRRAMDQSDVLLIFLLKGRRPGIYNRKTLVVEGNPDAPLQGNATVMIYPRKDD